MATFPYETTKPREDGPTRPTAKQLARYYSRPSQEFPGKIILCLSGGGYRASLFHLGAMRRLNELGLISRLSMISAVSGGSIFAGFLATRLRGRWPDPGERVPDWEERIEHRFREFTVKRDLRTSPLVGQLRSGNVPVEELARMLTRRYSKLIGDEWVPLTLRNLDEGPEIVFGATEISNRTYWTMSRTGIGSFPTGYPRMPEDLAGQWTVGRAVAASACFPPVFGTMDVAGLMPSPSIDYLANRGLEPTLRLTDGGVYDNTGYLAAWNKGDTVMVSDGGKSLEVEKTKRRVVSELMRYSDIRGYAGRSWGKAFMLANFMSEHQDGAYWGLRTKMDSYGTELPRMYSEEIVRSYISNIRTDIGPFTPDEQMILINHGYLSAAASIRRWLPTLDDKKVEIIIPYPESMEAAHVRDVLQNSHRRPVLGLQI